MRIDERDDEGRTPRVQVIDLRSVPSARTASAARQDDLVESLAVLPLMLTVTEAARVLRISRTSAYKLADEWRRTNGATGLPTVKLGSRVLVRRVDLAGIVGEQLTG